MDIFYKASGISDGMLLDKNESGHCIRVLRKKAGDQIRLIDGVGGMYICEITEADPQACRLSLISKTKQEALAYDLTIAIAPTKSMDRFESFLEKATEIGVTRIIPLLCERSERRSVRMDRMEKVILAAAKQSEKAYLPFISEPIHFLGFIEEYQGADKLIAHCEEEERADLWHQELSDDIVIAIGPEGDFSEKEIMSAKAAGFRGISLGAYRLRTETAGIVACSSVYFQKH